MTTHHLEAVLPAASAAGHRRLLEEHAQRRLRIDQVRGQRRVTGQTEVRGGSQLADTSTDQKSQVKRRSETDHSSRTGQWSLTDYNIPETNTDK